VFFFQKETIDLLHGSRRQTVSFFSVVLDIPLGGPRIS